MQLCLATASHNFKWVKITHSPGILGFEMNKNNIKLKISVCVQNVFPFFTKFKMAAKRHVAVLIPELFDIYLNVIPHFHMIFNVAISNF